MKPKEVLSLIEEGEGFRVEFKQRFSDYEKISKELIAFANSKGGYLIIGVDDDKSIKGVESEKSEAAFIIECAEKYCEPPIKYKLNYIEIKHKELVVVEVFESEIKPHRIQDYKKEIDITTAKVFVRVNDKSIPASKEMIKILQAQSNESPLKNYTIDKNERMVFEYLQQNETITVKEFADFSNISNRRASRTLIKLVRAGMLNIHVKDNGENFFTSAI
jgi:predicted HTH transcriptional regulator